MLRLHHFKNYSVGFMPGGILKNQEDRLHCGFSLSNLFKQAVLTAKFSLALLQDLVFVIVSLANILAIYRQLGPLVACWLSCRVDKWYHWVYAVSSQDIFVEIVCDNSGHWVGARVDNVLLAAI